MPFENFYKSSDEIIDKHRIRTILTVFGLIAFIFVGSAVFGDLMERRREADSEAARVVDVETTCRQLPTPEDFVFDGKTEPVHYQNGTLITYRFRTAQPIKNLLPTLSRLFEQTGWQPPTGNSTIFYKDGQQISIKYDEIEPNSYAIDCFADKIDLVIYD